MTTAAAAASAASYGCRKRVRERSSRSVKGEITGIKRLVGLGQADKKRDRKGFN